MGCVCKVLWDMEQQIKIKSTKQQRTQKRAIGDAERCISVYMIVVRLFNRRGLQGASRRVEAEAAQQDGTKLPRDAFTVQVAHPSTQRGARGD